MCGWLQILLYCYLTTSVLPIALNYATTVAQAMHIFHLGGRASPKLGCRTFELITSRVVDVLHRQFERDRRCDRCSSSRTGSAAKCVSVLWRCRRYQWNNGRCIGDQRVANRSKLDCLGSAGNRFGANAFAKQQILSGASHLGLTHERKLRMIGFVYVIRGHRIRFERCRFATGRLDRLTRRMLIAEFDASRWLIGDGTSSGKVQISAAAKYFKWLCICLRGRNVRIFDCPKALNGLPILRTVVHTSLQCQKVILGTTPLRFCHQSGSRNAVRPLSCLGRTRNDRRPLAHNRRQTELILVPCQTGLVPNHRCLELVRVLTANRVDMLAERLRRYVRLLLGRSAATGPDRPQVTRILDRSTSCVPIVFAEAVPILGHAIEFAVEVNVADLRYGVAFLDRRRPKARILAAILGRIRQFTAQMQMTSFGRVLSGDHCFVFGGEEGLRAVVGVTGVWVLQLLCGWCSLLGDGVGKMVIGSVGGRSTASEK